MIDRSAWRGAKEQQAMQQYAPMLIAAANRHGIDPRFLFSHMHSESGGNPNARGPTNDHGLFQFIPATARRLGLENPYDPVASADAAARLIAENMKKAGGNVVLGTSYYNGRGPVAIAYAQRVLRGLSDYDKYVGGGKQPVYAIEPSKVIGGAVGKAAKPASASAATQYADNTEPMYSAPVTNSVQEAPKPVVAPVDYGQFLVVPDYKTVAAEEQPWRNNVNTTDFGTDLAAASGLGNSLYGGASSVIPYSAPAPTYNAIDAIMKALRSN